MINLEDYLDIVGDETISLIHRKARKLLDRHVLHINSTYQGGGVAEILSSLVPLMNDVGIDAGWRIFHGNPDFFAITKKFHNGLQGDSLDLTEMKKKLYVQANERFSVYTHIDHDCVIIHDPQPLPLINFFKKRQPWIWRCHVDLSSPNEKLWKFLKKFILRYDAVVVSNEKFKKGDLPLHQKVIYPAIDPLIPKNMEIPEEIISKYMKKYYVPVDKPILTQISRFDKWKNPGGVIEIFELVRREMDCRLVLCGSMAADDPEGMRIYEQVGQKAKKYLKDKDIVLITSENSLLVNALQRSSTVIIQASLREGFGLTVTEALFKEKPVVASNVGGIPVQVEDGKSGFLVDPLDYKGFAERIIYLLRNQKEAREMGKEGRKAVKEKFLMTRLLLDYLDLLAGIIG